MSIRIAPPTVVRKFLKEADERYGTTGTYVDVHQCSIGDTERRFEIFKTITEKTSPDGVRQVDYKLQMYELMWLEFELALADCNIEDHDGTPLIEFADGKVKDPKSMVRKFRAMQDHKLSSEIHTCILEVNSHWKTSGTVPVGE